MLFLHKNPNSFGGFVLEIEIDTLFKIFINQANEILLLISKNINGLEKRLIFHS